MTTTYSPTNPHQVADQAGIPVIYADPGEGNLGRWDGKHIILLPGLTWREERSVLAHELSHALHDDPPHLLRVLSPKIERRCDKEAAHMLINPAELKKLLTAYPDDLGQVAYELEVTLDLLEAYLASP